jgi:hypothetical protein
VGAAARPDGAGRLGGAFSPVAREKTLAARSLGGEAVARGGRTPGDT